MKPKDVKHLIGTALAGAIQSVTESSLSIPADASDADKAEILSAFNETRTKLLSRFQGKAVDPAKAAAREAKAAEKKAKAAAKLRAAAAKAGIEVSELAGSAA